MQRDIGWIWDLCLKFMYNGEYANSLDKFLKKNNVKRVLDASCGVGFPAIDLSKLGYDVFCSDGSGEMLNMFDKNAAREGVKIESKKIFWQDLSKQFGEEFDLVMCRGNSLPYVVSWHNEKPNLKKAPAEIEESIRNFYSVLKPDGICYIDLSPRESFTPKLTHIIEEFEYQDINGEKITMIWDIKHDLVNHIRIWNPEITMEKKGSNIVEKVNIYYKAYHMRHSELVSMMKTAGFKKVEKYVDLAGESNYDIFIGYK